MKKDQNYCPRFTSANTRRRAGGRAPGTPGHRPASRGSRAPRRLAPSCVQLQGRRFRCFYPLFRQPSSPVAALRAAQLHSPSQWNGTSGALKLRARPAAAPASRTPPPAALTARASFHGSSSVLHTLTYNAGFLLAKDKMFPESTKVRPPNLFLINGRLSCDSIINYRGSFEKQRKSTLKYCRKTCFPENKKKLSAF